MQTTTRNGAGRQVAVRLCDVPLKIRRRYGHALYEAAVLDSDLLLAAQIHAAMEKPSTRVYWLPEKAVRRVMRPRMR